MAVTGRPDRRSYRLPMAKDPLNKRFQLPPMLAVLAIIAVLFATLAYSRSGRAETETAVITSFGTWSGDKGNHPIVVVRLASGRTMQLTSPDGVLAGCRVGMQITLLRQGGFLQPAPFACSGKQ